MEPTVTDQLDTALLPCPFCGDPKTAIIEDPPPKPQWAFVKCTLCHCAGPTCGSRDMAIKRWNTRAASQADTARAEGVALGLFNGLGWGGKLDMPENLAHCAIFRLA